MIAEWEKPWHLAVMELDIQVQRRVRAGRSFTDDEVMLLAIVARDEECGPESVRAVARCIERGVIDAAWSLVRLELECELGERRRGEVLCG